jgi:cytochrome b6-f complex iron-sulfur subunit
MPAAMPVAEAGAQESSLLSGAAFVAGASVTFAALALYNQKKKATSPKLSPATVATLAIEAKATWDDAIARPWSPLTPEQSLVILETEKRVAMLAAAADEFVPDMQRRTIMNLVLLGGAAVPVAWLGGGFVYFFVPPGGGGGGGGLVAKDALGDDVTVAGWTKAHAAGDRSLVQGLKGDAHYLIVEQDGTIRDYALNAVCTHLGCVVPWNRAANKFMCPCHGSQYDETGKVVRGPAPLSLALAHLDIDETDQVVLSPWTETDFRTNTPPWWKS